MHQVSICGKRSKIGNELTAPQRCLKHKSVSGQAVLGVKEELAFDDKEKKNTE